MNIFKSLLLLSFNCIIVNSTIAQDSKPVPTEVQTSYAIKLGRTAPLNELVRRKTTSSNKKKAYKNMIIPPRNFVGRYPNREVVGKQHHGGVDKIRQSSFLKNKSFLIEPLINRDGLIDGTSPQDPSGDVGLDYYMQAINITDIGLFDKVTGELVEQFAANTLWTPLGFNSGGDPIILYDQEQDRWIITEFPAGFSAASNQLLVAISVTSDPMGSYDVYNFSTPSFPDYPKYAVWNNCYSVTTNEQGGGVLHGYFINREEMLAGEEIVSIQRVSFPGSTQTEAGFFVATPVDWTGKTPPPSDRGPIVLSLNDASWNTGQAEDQLEIFSLALDWENENNTAWSQLSLEVSPYDSYPCAEAGFFFSCIPQPATLGLDGIPETIMNQTHYRNFGTHESIVLNFITDVTDGNNLSGIRWMELRRDNTQDWYVYQEGTYAPDDGLHRFMGGIAMDGSGNIALAFNVANDTTFAGIRYTGRRSGDSLGMMTVDEYVVVDGLGAINDGTRFGDYAHMTVDPVNDKTFWYTSEYGGVNGSRTRIVAYEISKDTFDIGPLSFKSPLTNFNLSGSELVEIEVKNLGLNPVDSFIVGYITNGNIGFEENVVFDLQPDSVYVHQFSQTADLSNVGDYDFIIYTSHPKDKAVFNDTVSARVKNLADIDLSLSSVKIFENVVCGTATTIGLGLTNIGFDTIKFADIEISVNDGQPSNFIYSGSLSTDDNELFNIPIDNLVEGNNEITAKVLSVNMLNDTFLLNNELNFSLQSISDGFLANVVLLLDDYADETSWVIEDSSGMELASGGPYERQQAQELIEASVCLDPKECYRFILRDSYGDGISFNGVSGDYQIIDNNGLILAKLMDVNFGNEEINEFCATFICSISLNANSSPSTGVGLNDGFIMVEVLNGLGPFSYSINDGQSIQTSNVFSDLEPGTYTVIVNGANNCSESIEVEVQECQLSVLLEVLPEIDINSSDGQITIVAGGEIGPLSYSIDGGINFSDDNVFTGLSIGEYDILVKDSLGCIFEDIVRVGNIVGIEDLIINSVLRVYPNPTDGVFRIILEGWDKSDYNIDISLFDNTGRLIQKSKLSRYNDYHLGIMSLYHYPIGSYYLKIENAKDNRLYRVLRQ